MSNINIDLGSLTHTEDINEGGGGGGTLERGNTVWTMVPGSDGDRNFLMIKYEDADPATLDPSDVSTYDGVVEVAVPLDDSAGGPNDPFTF